MAEQKKGQKPKGSIENAKVAEGQQKPISTGDVSGHMSPGAYYICWNCMKVVWVPQGWDYFYCWNCTVLNKV